MAKGFRGFPDYCYCHGTTFNSQTKKCDKINDETTSTVSTTSTTTSTVSFLKPMTIEDKCSLVCYNGVCVEKNGREMCSCDENYYYQARC